MTERELVPHAAAGAARGLSLLAGVTRAPGAGSIRVVYRLAGDLTAVRVPPPARAERADALWEHTCFELFAAPSEGERYIELNFAPSTQWAAYAFDGYRYRMRRLELGRPPHLHVERASGLLTVTASAELGALVDSPAPWRVGVCAVVEDTEGQRSYWALQHSGPRPDFHATTDWVWRV